MLCNFVNHFRCSLQVFAVLSVFSLVACDSRSPLQPSVTAGPAAAVTHAAGVIDTQDHRRPRPPKPEDPPNPWDFYTKCLQQYYDLYCSGDQHACDNRLGQVDLAKQLCLDATRRLPGVPPDWIPEGWAAPPGDVDHLRPADIRRPRPPKPEPPESWTSERCFAQNPSGPGFLCVAYPWLYPHWVACMQSDYQNVTPEDKPLYCVQRVVSECGNHCGGGGDIPGLPDDPDEPNAFRAHHAPVSRR